MGCVALAEGSNDNIYECMAKHCYDKFFPKACVQCKNHCINSSEKRSAIKSCVKNCAKKCNFLQGKTADNYRACKKDNCSAVKAGRAAQKSEKKKNRAAAKAAKKERKEKKRERKNKGIEKSIAHFGAIDCVATKCFPSLSLDCQNCHTNCKENSADKAARKGCNKNCSDACEDDKAAFHACKKECKGDSKKDRSSDGGISDECMESCSDQCSEVNGIKEWEKTDKNVMLPKTRKRRRQRNVSN